jgi:cysteine desulfurase / selenocysteine lyase
MNFSADNLKSAFPIFQKNSSLTYLDNAATTQKPNSVIETITEFYKNENANIHRGLYELSSNATIRYEKVREKVKNLVGAKSEKEIAFTKGTTEAINIVANSLSSILNEGDNIVVSEMEHHANLIPWQQVCLKKKASLRIIPINHDGDLILESLDTLLDKRTKLLAVAHISNTLGTINPIQEIISIAHKKNIPVLLDAAQSVGHYPIQVSDLDVDFMAFSAHKMFGPMGTGVLFAKEKHHAQIHPLNFGGGAIREVSFGETKFMDFPFSLEAGTPHVAGVLGLGTAVDFVQQLDLSATTAHTRSLALNFKNEIQSLGFVKAIGNPKKSGGIVSFVVDGIHAHDVAGFLAEHNIAVRAGHHCTQPLHERLGLQATVRVSFSIYNTPEDVDKTIVALRELKKFWS